MAVRLADRYIFLFNPSSIKICWHIDRAEAGIQPCLESNSTFSHQEVDLLAFSQAAESMLISDPELKLET